MKCVCGYEHEYNNELFKGKDIFIKTEIQVNNWICKLYTSENRHKNSAIRTMYACPKCGTLKIII
jgi:hypothetical protein